LVSILSVIDVQLKKKQEINNKGISVEALEKVKQAA